ncbi:hypothetical protein JG688_00018605 [Phytophthora aleatoria]|uniref:Uncharacterized protein n=1 Tax=Phytophthora aleatoria TaxID=2496075 RepID=A0A8J5M0I8_9STRA|nr:hypothetical protein JG688_00018605 [Phytophthora aleatoria]
MAIRWRTQLLAFFLAFSAIKCAPKSTSAKPVSWSWCNGASSYSGTAREVGQRSPYERRTSDWNDANAASTGALQNNRASSWCFQCILVVEEAFPSPSQAGDSPKDAWEPTTPVDAREKLAEFGCQVLAKMKELRITKVYHADQTGVNYEYVPASTVDKRGAKTVWVKCTGKSKERVTAMLLADRDGNKTDPFMLFQVQDSRDRESQHRCSPRIWAPTLARLAEATGWWNSELAIEFLWYHFGRRENMHDPVLLLWDDSFDPLAQG